MRAVRTAQFSAAAGRAWGRAANRSSVAWVARNPRHRKLRRMSGRAMAARRNRRCACPSSALNRQSRSHMGGNYLQQAVLQKTACEFGEIGAKLFGVGVVFREQSLERGLNVWRSSEQLPHAGTRRVESEIPLGLEIQQNRFPIQKSHEDMRGDAGTIGKGKHNWHLQANTQDNPAQPGWFCLRLTDFTGVSRAAPPARRKPRAPAPGSGEWASGDSLSA